MGRRFSQGLFSPVKSVSSHLFELVLKKEHRRALSSHSNTLQLVLPVQMTKPRSHRYYTINLQASKTCIALCYSGDLTVNRGLTNQTFPIFFSRQGELGNIRGSYQH